MNPALPYAEYVAVQNTHIVSVGVTELQRILDVNDAEVDISCQFVSHYYYS